MGICYHDAKMLWEARLRGVSFQQTLTVAHLFLYLHPAEVRALRKAYLAKDHPFLAQPMADYLFGEYSDRFFRDFLGTASLEILDNSQYEGATIICDLNQPISKNYWGRFDAVIDARSLEHIFNVPVAIGNLMRMTKVGGSIFITTPANNLCGHGFYQFSPELMFRVFSTENGFELKRVVFLEASFPGVELTPCGRAYQVADPASVRERVELRSKNPIMMMVEATKTDDVLPFAATPQQSDYVAAWNQVAPPSGGVEETLKPLVKKLPLFLRGRLQGHYQRWHNSFSNRRLYKRL